MNEIVGILKTNAKDEQVAENRYRRGAGSWGYQTL